MFIIYVILASILQVVLQYILSKKYRELCSKLLPFAIIILITAALSNGIVQGIKPFAARERFRAFYYFEYRNVAHQGFTNWYIFNGSAKEIAATYPEELNVTKSFYTSFPSGHTCGAAITYTMMFFPVFIDKLNKKKTSWIFIAIPVVYTGIVAFTRILIGAHYLSDVLFGGTITFISAIIAYYIVKKFIGKKCIIYSLNDNQITGVIKEVSDGALLIEKDGNLQAVNLDFIVRIREYPTKKNGKEKSVILD